MSSLGARLTYVREVRGLSQQDLAQRTGLKVQNISRLETGHRVHVRSDTLLRLAEALRCSADYLIGLTDDPTPRRRTAAAPLPPRQPQTRTRRQSAVPTQPHTAAPVS
jgi:transcriptional regulator with XRE-family HTH domain